MNIKQYRKLCVKEITGNINETEKKILDSWLNESVENRNEYEKIKSIWIETAPNEIPFTLDSDSGWLALNSKLEQDKIELVVKNSASHGRYSFIRPALRPVFAGTIAILLLFLSIYIVNREAPLQLKTITTLDKEHKEIKLPDGSTALLNGSSQVKFLENFDEGSREINLKGEAFFSVSKNGSSFIVRTGNARTTVLGTKFNIRAYDEKTEVFVKEGKVSLQQSKLNDESVVLSKGQFSSVNKNQPPTLPKKIDPCVLGWIDGKLVFNQTPLTEIVDELERFYNTQVSIEESSNLKNQTLSGSFSNQEIDNVLNMICTALDLDFERQDEGYIIKSKSTNQ